MKIEAVLFDMGGTIEDIRHDRVMRLKALPGILSILGRAGIVLPGSDEEILAKILGRNAEYKAWSESVLVESPPEVIWREWNLKDFDPPSIPVDKAAEELAFAWETTFFERKIRPDAKATLEALAERGYRMGIISNTSSRTQVFRTLDSYGIAEYFECVILSSIEGLRKPHASLFDSALRKMGIPASAAAYVGDTLSRDVIGSKAAGYALAFRIDSFMTAASDTGVVPDAGKPDFVVESLGEIIGILDSMGRRRTP